jgi:hypothetical protein
MSERLAPREGVYPMLKESPITRTFFFVVEGGCDAPGLQGHFDVIPPVGAVPPRQV